MKKIKFILLSFSITIFVLMPLSLHAQLKNAPPNFMTPDGQAIFVDFKTATYNLTYDSSAKMVDAISRITFLATDAGLPIFDLVENPTKILLDDEVVQNKIINSPDGETKFRIVLKNIDMGMHTLEIHSYIKSEVSFANDGVVSAFWFSDLNDRSFLEAYLPASFEFDSYKMIFNIDFKNFVDQRIYANGNVTKIDDSHFSIEFPEYYTSSSIFFHTAPIGKYPEKLFNFHSIDGRDIPVTVYSPEKNSNLEIFKNEIIENLTKLESLYGPYLHQSLIVFTAESADMEYCGATMTGLANLNHELTHSYFARGGFMPANGNAGWIDEALATWSDDGRPERSRHFNMKANLAGHSEYRRFTAIKAYSKGKHFMGYLNHKFEGRGGLTPFLNELIKTSSFKPITTEEFIEKMSNFYGEDLAPLFLKYVYPKKYKGKIQ